MEGHAIEDLDGSQRFVDKVVETGGEHFFEFPGQAACGDAGDGDVAAAIEAANAANGFEAVALGQRPINPYEVGPPGLEHLDGAGAGPSGAHIEAGSLDNAVKIGLFVSAVFDDQNAGGRLAGRETEDARGCGLDRADVESRGPPGGRVRERRLGLGAIEDFIDGFGQLSGAAIDDDIVLTDVVGDILVGPGGITEEKNGIERGAELVAHVGEEGAFGAGGSEGLVAGRVELFGSEAEHFFEPQLVPFDGFPGGTGMGEGFAGVYPGCPQAEEPSDRDGHSEEHNLGDADAAGEGDRGGLREPASTKADEAGRRQASPAEEYERSQAG